MIINKLFNFKVTLIVFIVGVILFFWFKNILSINYWCLIIWINLFLIIQFCGAYFIGLNFHLESKNKLKTQQKKVLLTFDDGPCKPYTTRVLEVLKKHQVSAIFFVIGKNIKGNESVIFKMVEEGHVVGNHSFSHHNWIDIWSTKKVITDFELCQQALKQCNVTTRYFRPPYGVTNPNISKAIKMLWLQSIGWNVRSYDTSIKDIEKIKQRILAKLKPGAIILLHDRLEFMPDLLERLIPEIKRLGYEFSSPTLDQ